jgi:Flp pilus assembly protein TadG
MTRRGSQPKRRGGSVAVEAGIILPIFLMILLGIFEYSRFVMVRNLVDNAAREGARYAVVHTYDLSTSQIQSYTQGKLAGQDGQLSGLKIQVFKADPATGSSLDVWTNAAFGDWIMVQITGTYSPAVPRLLMMSNSIAVKAQAMMRCEAN